MRSTILLAMVRSKGTAYLRGMRTCGRQTSRQPRGWRPSRCPTPPPGAGLVGWLVGWLVG